MSIGSVALGSICILWTSKVHSMWGHYLLLFNTTELQQNIEQPWQDFNNLHV